MRSTVLIRRGFYLLTGMFFLYALVGMFVTGPIVVRVPRYKLDIEPSPWRLRATVDLLCHRFAPRSFQDRESLDRTADWIADQFRFSGLRTEFQEYELEEGRYRNVIAVRPGSDPEAAAIVIGAHYDAVVGTPGANDNASGIAVLLELARTLPDVQPRRTHYFVAFGTEEPPFFDTEGMGSHHFARKLKDEGVELLLMLSLDVVGYYSDDFFSQSFPNVFFRLLYPSRGNFVAIIGDAGSGPAIERTKRGLKAGGRLPVQSFRAPRSSGMVRMSDHLSFRNLDYPAVQITDTAFMRYAYYHRPDDTPEKLDYDRMAALVESLHGVLWEGGPRR